MNPKRITTGLIFLFIGSILLLNKMNIVDFNWLEVIRFWPLLIILLGVNILVPKNETGYMISIGTTSLILGIFTYIGITTPNSSILAHLMNNNHIEINTDDSDDLSATAQRVAVNNIANLQTATLNVDLGATQIILNESTTTHVFEASNNSDKYFLALHTDTQQMNTAEINLSGKTKKGNNIKGNTTNIKLNKDIIWDINYDLGAADVKNDLSLFKIRSLNIDAGASSLDLKLGQALSESKINIDAGASSIHIAIPHQVACIIQTEMALSSLDADDSFLKGEGKGMLKTANYDSATNKFNINIDGGITSVRITRY